MSKIDDLIKELCPDGVEFKKLGSICKIETGKLNANASCEDGKYPFFTTAKEISRIDTFRWDEEALLIAGNANVGDVKYFKGKFEAYQRTYVLTDFSNLIDIRFLFFCLSNNLKQYLASRKNDAAMTYIVLGTLQNFPIPIPPLEVQKEIVRVLDSFTALEAELEAELEARKKQYEYYRNTLLTFNERERVEYVQIGDVCNMKRGKRVIKSQLNDTGIYPVYQNSLFPLGFFNEYNCRAGSVFMISAGAAGNIGFSNVDFWAADDCWIFDCSQNLSERFLYYALKNQQNTINSGVRRSSIPRLSRIFIENIKISLPPLEKQKQIVSILDKFEKLTNDIAFGLPAEIEARRKQYEYYRTKLLTFKEA